MWPLIVVLITIWGSLQAKAPNPQPQPVAPANSLRAMTYNIRYATERDGVNRWVRRKDAVALAIRRADVDVVGLQEVLARQWKDLRASLPRYDGYAVARNANGSGESAPILWRRSRFERRASGTFWLSETPDRKGSKSWDAALPRIASWAVLRDTTTSRDVLVVNTHFDHRGRIAREKSARLIRSWLAKRAAGKPVVLLGDFNTLPQSTPHLVLAKDTPDAFEVSETPPAGPRSTWNGFQRVIPNRRIDFVFVSRKWRVRRHLTLNPKVGGRFASDHLPVVVELESR